MKNIKFHLTGLKKEEALGPKSSWKKKKKGKLWQRQQRDDPGNITPADARSGATLLYSFSFFLNVLSYTDIRQQLEPKP
jgi:hypothetical protein